MPHSKFRGAGDGSWTPLDRRKALAFHLYQASVCAQCGTRQAEWDPDMGGDPYAYVAIGRKCFGCEEIQREQKEIPESAAAGMKVVLMPASVLAAMDVERALT